MIYTILLQRSELELQREELRQTRVELSRSAQAQMDQVSRLEEAADLSAISTLVNVYGTLLQPVRDATHETRVQMTWAKRTLTHPEAPETEKDAARDRLEQLQLELNIQEEGWSDTIEKHKRLVERLETLVGERYQEQGSQEGQV